MKRFRVRLPGCLLVMILLGACTSPKEIPLPADFWAAEKRSIGVALARTPMPQVKTCPSLFGHPLPYGQMLAGGDEGYDEGGEFGDQGGQPESRQYRGPAKGAPAPPVEADTLKASLRAVDAGLLLALQKHFVKRLSHAGWHVEPIHGPIGNDYRHKEGLQGYDALILIDCDRYGVRCRAQGRDRVKAPTFVSADMHARMIDLKSDRIIWQSPRKKAGNFVSCMCDDPACFPVIRSALKKSVDRAGDALLADLFRNRP